MSQGTGEGQPHPQPGWTRSHRSQGLCSERNERPPGPVRQGAPWLPSSAPGGVCDPVQFPQDSLFQMRTAASPEGRGLAHCALLPPHGADGARTDLHCAGLGQRPQPRDRRARGVPGADHPPIPAPSPTWPGRASLAASPWLQFRNPLEAGHSWH